MLGDTRDDAEAARAAGVLPLGVPLPGKAILRSGGTSSVGAARVFNNWMELERISHEERTANGDVQSHDKRDRHSGLCESGWWSDSHRDGDRLPDPLTALSSTRASTSSGVSVTWMSTVTTPGGLRPGLGHRHR